MKTVWTAVVLAVAAAGSLRAHHSLSQFDATAAVRITGVVAHVAWVNPHTIVYVDEKRSDGRVQRWAVEGPGPVILHRLGIEMDVFRVGDRVEFCGYTLKDTFDVPRTSAVEAPGSKRAAAAFVSGRALAAEDVVLSDGVKRSWGDYGKHKCHSADDIDIHPTSPLSAAPSPRPFPTRPPQ